MSRMTCPLCKSPRTSWGFRETDEQWLEGHMRRIHADLQIGDGVTDRLVTDALAYVVVDRRGATVTLAPLSPTAEQQREWSTHIDGSPFPTMSHGWTDEEMRRAVIDVPPAHFRKASLRKDGCWRWVGAERYAGDNLLTGGAYSRTDYRY